MSGILFHSPSGEARLSGAERAHMGWMAAEIAADLLCDLPPERLATAMPLLRLRPTDNVHDRLSGFFAVADGAQRVIVGEDSASNPSVFTFALNTALREGAEREWDPLILAARLHGQCEVHCWVDGPNRRWLASIMRLGLRGGTFRRRLRGYGLGWGWLEPKPGQREKPVIPFLEERDDEPVVCSYTVCESFPSRGLCFDAGLWAPPGEHNEDPAKWTDEQWDSWFELSDKEQWRLGMESLRAEPLMEMRPDNWREYRFGAGLSAFDLLLGADE